MPMPTGRMTRDSSRPSTGPGPLANISFIVGKTYTVHDKIANTYSLIKILNVTPETITWDANSPLAGQNLTFTITVVGITKP